MASSIKKKAAGPSQEGVRIQAGSSGIASTARKLRLRQTLRVREFGQLLLRPITPKDEPEMVEFHQVLSEETIYQRYFEHICLESRIGHERLARICTNDDDSFALVAAVPARAGTPAAILAVGRLSRTEDSSRADFALLVHDKAQGHGIGPALMERLILLARACGFRQLAGEVLVANHEMQNVCRRFGFSLRTQANDGLLEACLNL
jgi:acetyltransferase